MVNNHAGGGGGTTETLKFGDKIILKFDTSDKGGIGFLTSTNGRNDNNKARPEQLSATIVDNTQIFGDTVESSIFAVVPPQQYKNQKLLFKNYGNRLQVKSKGGFHFIHRHNPLPHPYPPPPYTASFLGTISL